MASYTPPPEVIDSRHDYTSVTRKVVDIVLRRGTPKGWWLGFGVSFILLQVLFVSLSVLVTVGTGIWGINIPVAWGFAIINLVWWIGIGHAGTLISAILLLLNQEWRMAIARLAEAMTLFAVACAAIFPIFHIGRPWVLHWLFPYPNNMGVWPQFRSPLIWDVFAISTYASISFLFWFVGLVPDLATMRDKSQRRWVKIFYGLLAMGWRGSGRHWHRYEVALVLLAGLATPLVVSVHTVVSFDFAVSILPGWHTTIFPPYFVAGAVYSGFAMVLTLVIPVRAFYNLHDLITDRHLQNMAKIMLTTGLIVAYGYAMEAFIAWYSAAEFEQSMMRARQFTGPYTWFYWALIACNGVLVQFLWSKRVRQSPIALFALSIVVNIGMWLERFVIVVTSLSQDFMPSSWDLFVPTFWDYSTYLGTFGLFGSLVFLFIRVLPMVTMFEMRMLLEPKRETKS